MAYDETKPAGTDPIGSSDEYIRENFRALKEDKEVNAGKLKDYEPGNADGNVAVSNGTVCTNLNADKLDGQDGSYYQNADNINAGTLNVSRLPSNIDAAKIADGSVSNTEFQYLNGVTSAIQTQINNIASVPTGAVFWFAAATTPAGYLECNGAVISRTTYSTLYSAIGTTFGVGDGSTTFNLPDLRGEFIRGWDHGKEIDPGRSFGSAQADVLKAHTHTLPHAVLGMDQGAYNWNSSCVRSGSGVSGSAGDNETRPRNVALLPCIKY